MVFSYFNEIKKRVTIQDILLDCGHQPNNYRMPCPIHNGKNPTSFSFTDHVYHCHSCGASGGLIDLVESLLGFDRQKAMRYLSEKAGISLNDYSLSRRRSRKFSTRYKPAPTLNSRLCDLQQNLKIFEILRDHYTWRMIEARKNRKNKNIDVADYYTETQYTEYVLEELDAEVIKTNYEINFEKKRLRNSNKFRIRE